MTGPIPPWLGRRMVRLAAEPDGGPLVVAPALAKSERDGTGRRTLPRTFAPFLLPRVPLSLVRWCAAAAARFRDDRAACLGLVLLLDRPTRRWAPLIPTQVATARAVRLAPAASYFDRVPAGVVVAGSFQTLGRGDLFDAAAAVPPFGGVHLVELGRGRRRPPGSFLFVRSDTREEPALADPGAVLVDDLDQAFREAADRLRVE